ncbi:hypothetical protein BASA81_000263 [Batrachochytrium salamandrivorans]|nr:hypothetical protein BASA81_000263 [Batrachochytrium salamandrivorans]
MPVIHSPQQVREGRSKPPPPPPLIFDSEQENPPAQFKPKVKPQDLPPPPPPSSSSYFPEVTIFTDSTTTKLLQQQQAISKLGEQHDSLKRKAQTEMLHVQDKHERERESLLDTIASLKRTLAEDASATQTLKLEHREQTLVHSQTLAQIKQELATQRDLHTKLTQTKLEVDKQHQITLLELKEALEAAKLAQTELHSKQLDRMQQDGELKLAKLCQELATDKELALKEQRTAHYQQVELLQADLASRLAQHDALLAKFTSLAEQHQALRSTLQRERNEAEIQLSELEAQVQFERQERERERQEKQVEMEIATQRTDSALARALNAVKRTEEKLVQHHNNSSQNLEDEDEDRLVRYNPQDNRRRRSSSASASSLADGLDFASHPRRPSVSKRRVSTSANIISSRRSSVDSQGRRASLTSTQRRASLQSILNELDYQGDNGDGLPLDLSAHSATSSMGRYHADPFLLDPVQPRPPRQAITTTNGSKNFMSPTTSSKAKRQVKF